MPGTLTGAGRRLQIRLMSMLQALRLRSIGRVGIAAFACAALLSSPVPAQPSAALSPADFIEIQQLVNRLNFALDYCGNGGADFADLFVDGGRFVIDQGDGMPRTIEGREALIALAGGPSCDSRRTPPSAYILHLAESLVVEATEYGARGKSYAIYPSSQGRTLSAEVEGQLGIYYDEYVRTTDGWRFRSRRHVVNPVPGNLEF